MQSAPVPTNVRFSNRPFGVKHFQTIHHCIVDDTGGLVREVKVASEPEALLQAAEGRQALLQVLATPTYHFKRIGLEAGQLSQWLFSALAEAMVAFVYLVRSEEHTSELQSLRHLVCRLL